MASTSGCSENEESEGRVVLVGRDAEKNGLNSCSSNTGLGGQSHPGRSTLAACETSSASTAPAPRWRAKARAQRTHSATGGSTRYGRSYTSSWIGVLPSDWPTYSSWEQRMKWYRAGTEPGPHRGGRGGEEEEEVEEDRREEEVLLEDEEEEVVDENGGGGDEGVAPPPCCCCCMFQAFWHIPPAISTISSNSSVDPTHVVRRIWRTLLSLFPALLLLCCCCCSSNASNLGERTRVPEAMRLELRWA